MLITSFTSFEVVFLLAFNLPVEGHATCYTKKGKQTQPPCRGV